MPCERVWEDKHKVNTAETPQAHGMLSIMRRRDEGLITSCWSTGMIGLGVQSNYAHIIFLKEFFPSYFLKIERNDFF